MSRTARHVPCARRRPLLTSTTHPPHPTAAAGRLEQPSRRTLMRNVRIVALALALGLIATACGARLDPQVRKQAASAVLNAGSGTGTGTGTGVPGATATGGPTTGGAVTGGTAGTSGTSGTSGS